MDRYKVIVWDKQANDPYMMLEYDDEETAKYVARRMRKHYVEDWGAHAESYYEVRLHRIVKEGANA
jgi:uncharacterized protein (UPF0305 family)